MGSGTKNNNRTASVPNDSCNSSNNNSDRNIVVEEGKGRDVSSCEESASPSDYAPSSSSLASLVGIPTNRNISECCSSFGEVERVNIEKVRPLLGKVVETPFFSHFKIDLCSTCELWHDAPMCSMKECGVC